MADQPRTVLIVDDDRQLRQLLAEFLIAEGFSVLEAADGLEAVQTVRKASPDAMLLDLTMPKLGGLRTLESVREIDPDLHVVIMTGTLEPATLRHAVFSSAATVLTKPLQLEDIAAALRTQRATPAPATDPAAARPDDTRRILVVDDDDDFRITISEILRGQGYEVRGAADAASALAAVAADSPDLVLLDVQLPDWSGIDVIAMIRTLAPRVKVIMISGLTRQQVADQAFEQGVFDYIGKPIDPGYLELSIATALETN